MPVVDDIFGEEIHSKKIPPLEERKSRIAFELPPVSTLTRTQIQAVIDNLILVRDMMPFEGFGVAPWRTEKPRDARHDRHMAMVPDHPGHTPIVVVFDDQHWFRMSEGCLGCTLVRSADFAVIGKFDSMAQGALFLQRTNGIPLSPKKAPTA